MEIKNITLQANTESQVTYSGGNNVWIRNDSDAIVYASKSSGIVAGNDGVINIPSKQATLIAGALGTIYLLGEGSVSLIGTNNSNTSFNLSPSTDGCNAGTLDGIPASELDRVRCAVVGGVKAGVQWTGIDSTKGDTTVRMQVDADYDKLFLFKSTDGQKKWTSIELNADTLDGKHAEDFKILTFVDNDAEVTCIEARRDNTVIRLQIQTNMEIAKLFKSTNGGASWTELPLGNAASVGAYTEEKLAALEARIAALEAKT